MDFYKIVERSKRSELEIFPDFQTGEVTDLLGRGKSFYAIWDEEKKLWSRNENDVQRIVDEDIWKYAEEVKSKRGYDGYLNVKTLKSDSSGMWNRFTQYMRRFPDSNIQLDDTLTFLNTETKKKDYASKRLPYSLESGDYSAWDKLVGTLYGPEERRKIEWAIGAVISGDSKKIEKFFVFYGDPGSGKGTIIKIIEKLFQDYCIAFDAASLGNKSDQFSTEIFKSNPLVAVDPDGDLSRIDDNTRLNKIVSHETILLNEKSKPRYPARMNCFLFIGSNHTVKITDAKSGLRRRLIDINPTGKTFKSREYESLMNQINFELGAIAYHCLEVYRELGKNYYKNYIPQEMIEKTDVFFNFVDANIEVFERQTEGIGLRQAYTMWKEYREDSQLEFKLPMYRFREELKNYFEEFHDIARVDGKLVRSWYKGFKSEKMRPPVLMKEEKPLALVLDEKDSLLDDILGNCPAQYGVDDGSGNEKPSMSWDEVTTSLRQIDTKKTHYVQPQRYDKNFVVVDFDLKNDKGEKDMLLNAEAASKWPVTYTEFSKGGNGIHLHYIYDGDIGKVSVAYAPGIEIKIFRGKAALRRRVSWCNNIPVAHLPEGALPLKEEKMIDVTLLKDELHLRNLIKKCLRKDNHGATRPEVDLIGKVLDDAYRSGMSYDVSDMRHDVLYFAMGSTHQKDYCVKRVNEMHFMCREAEDKAEAEKHSGSIGGKKDDDAPLVFYDVEVFPNLFLVNWKYAGPDHKVVRMINPSPGDIEKLFGFRLVGFNCRKYDNHMIYARYLGKTVEEIYDLSRRIIVEGAKDAFFPEAYNISYTDIYDFCSKKQSLKKWEIELGIHHQELGLPWDKSVPEELWEKVAEYCDNDVIATEATWEARQADFKARQILADISGGCVNDTTNQLSTRFIFGDNRNPQGEFNYRNMGVSEEALLETTAQFVTLDTFERNDIFETEKAGFPFKSYWSDAVDQYDFERCKYTSFDDLHHVKDYEHSYLPVFPGYKYEFGKSTYRGEEVGEGGYVYAEPGIHTNVALLDIASMHPSSIVAEDLFGKRYTDRFKEILDARIAIKHKDFDRAKKMLDGKLSKYLTDESAAKDLAGALKIVINSVYGLTSAKFPNPFRDPRNVDNIVAKRGALFMVNLKHEVQNRGFTVAHIKTDSIKIPNATPEIIQFVMDYGKMYGYNFEHEATYDRMCLVNDAVYIAYDKEEGWTATGAQFQQPYVFKQLFSGEEITFDDMCETKSVTGGAIYLDMNEKLPDVSDAEEDLSRRKYNKVHPDKQKKLSEEYEALTDEELADYISEGHDYNYVGRVGLFTPIKKGFGGGILVREKDGKYSSVTGTKGYRWLESEVVRQGNKESDVDIQYYENLVGEAIKSIGEYGNFDSFIDVSKPYISLGHNDKEPVAKDISPKSNEDDDPPWADLPSVVPCGDGKYNSCLECPHCDGDTCDAGYSLCVFSNENASKMEVFDP